METQAKTQTCLLTIVSSGQSDAVLKIHPSDHADEKLWLDYREDMERYQAVKTFLQRYAKRGTFVSEPKPLCGDAGNLRQRDLPDSDIPVVYLEPGVVFEERTDLVDETPEEPKIPESNPVETQAPPQTENGRMDRLEAKLEALAGVTESLVAALRKPVADAKRRGRPRKAKAAPEPQESAD